MGERHALVNVGHACCARHAVLHSRKAPKPTKNRTGQGAGERARSPICQHQDIDTRALENMEN